MGGAIGSVLGTVADVALMGTNPALAIAKTVGANVLSNAFAGGGGSSPAAGGGSTPQYALPDYNYGTNTYTLGGKPYDASKYFITGDKGVYNLLPMLGDVYQDPNKKDMTTGSYNTYQSIYDKMAGDAAAQAAFAKAYAPQTYTYAPPTPRVNKPVFNAFGTPVPEHVTSGTNAFGIPNNGGLNNRYGDPRMFKGLNISGDTRKDLYSTLQNQLKAAQAYNNPNGRINGRTSNQTNGVLNNSLNLNNVNYDDKNINKNTTTPTNPYTYTPIQYVNWNLGDTTNAFADYAAKQKNPFFVPFAPKPAATTTTTTPAPVNPTGSLTAPGQTPAPFNSGGIIGLLRN